MPPGSLASLSPSPQRITARLLASAPHSATPLPCHLPRPPKCPSPGPSASSPLIFPFPRPSVRKAKAALAVSLCEHGLLLLPCLGASVRLPGRRPHPRQGSPSQASSPLPPRCPDAREGSLPWEETFPSLLPILAEVRSGSPCHTSVLSAHLPQPTARAPHPRSVTLCLHGLRNLTAFTSSPDRVGSNFRVDQGQHLSDRPSCLCLPGQEAGWRGHRSPGAHTQLLCGLEEASPHEAAPINCLFPMSSLP